MNEAAYPRPVEDLWDAVSEAELAQAAREYVIAVESAMLEYLVDSRARELTDQVSAHEVNLIAEADVDEIVLIKITSLGTMMARTAIVGMSWQTGERKGGSTSYYLDLDNKVVRRRDRVRDELALMHARMEEELGKSTEDATYDELIAARMVIARETEDNRMFEREHGLNDVPVDLGEIRWLGSILMDSYPLNENFE